VTDVEEDEKICKDGEILEMECHTYKEWFVRSRYIVCLCLDISVSRRLSVSFNNSCICFETPLGRVALHHGAFFDCFCNDACTRGGSMYAAWQNVGRTADKSGRFARSLLCGIEGKLELEPELELEPTVD
jgi:hypothetical protein